MPPFNVMMMNVFIIALIIVFCQVIDARITNLAKNTTSNTPNLEAETAMSDEGATRIGGKTFVFENDEIKKEVSYNSFSIIETDKANRTPIVDGSKNGSLEKATIMATATPMSDRSAAFVRDEVLVFENDGIEKASTYNSLSNININKVAAPFEETSKATALFEDEVMNESLKKDTIIVPDVDKNTKLENIKTDIIEKGKITVAYEAKTISRKLTSTFLGAAESFGIACGGAVAIATNAIINSNIVTPGAFSVGESATVFGDIDCVGSASIGANVIFSGNIVSQAAFSLGAGGIFTGDIFANAVVVAGASEKVVGNIYASKAFALFPGASVTGQVLQENASLQVPSSNDTKVLADIGKAYDYLKLHPGAKDLETSIIKNALLPGVYFNVAAWSFEAGRILLFNGTSSDTWIIQLGGAATIYGNMYNVGALPSNIQWAVAGQLNVGNAANFCGYAVSLAPIILETGASLIGSIYSSAGACTIRDGARLTRFPMTTRPMSAIPKTRLAQVTQLQKPVSSPMTPTTHASAKIPTTYAPTKKSLLEAADSFDVACGGTVVIAPNAYMYGNAVTPVAFYAGDGSTVFDDIDFLVGASLGKNSSFFSRTLIRQGGVALGGVVKVQPGGLFTGDVFSKGTVTISGSENVVGNIYGYSKFALRPGGSVNVTSSNGANALADTDKAYTYLKSQPGAKDLESSIFNNELLPGIYFHSGAWTFGSGRTLAFKGTSSDTWIICSRGSRNCWKYR